MVRNILMIAACLVVGGTMAVTWILFKRRLRKIEEERWGKKTDIAEKRPGEHGKTDVKGEQK